MVEGEKGEPNAIERLRELIAGLVGMAPEEAGDRLLTFIASPEAVPEVARVIASGLGDNYEHAFTNKSEWNRERGEKGGRYRDINEPMQPDYDDAAQAILQLLALKGMGE